MKKILPIKYISYAEALYKLGFHDYLNMFYDDMLIDSIKSKITISKPRFIIHNHKGKK